MTRRKSVPIKELSSLKMSCGNEKKFKKVIDDGILKEWVGIGWIALRRATKSDASIYPKVVRQ